MRWQKYFFRLQKQLWFPRRVSQSGWGSVRLVPDPRRPRTMKTLVLALLLERYIGKLWLIKDTLKCVDSQNSGSKQHLATSTWMITRISQNSNRTLLSLSPHFHFYLIGLEELSAISPLQLTTLNVWQMFLFLGDSVSKKDVGRMEDNLLWTCRVWVLLAYVCLTHIYVQFMRCAITGLMRPVMLIFPFE